MDYVPPTPKELETLIAATNMTRRQIARLVDVSERAVYSWLSGDSPCAYAYLYVLLDRGGLMGTEEARPDNWRNSLP